MKSEEETSETCSICLQECVDRALIPQCLRNANKNKDRTFCLTRSLIEQYLKR